jgi:hypothetical protein
MLVRTPDRGCRGAILIDVTIAVMVFLASFAAFLALASDKSSMLDDAERHLRVVASAEAELGRLAALPFADLQGEHGHDFVCAGLPGKPARGQVRVHPTALPNLLLVEVEVTWTQASGHPGRYVLSTLQGPRGLAGPGEGQR